MKNILAVYSSLSGETGQSTQLANYLLQQLDAKGEYQVIKRDLAAMALPHLDADEMQSWMTEASARTEQQQALAARSDALIEDVKQADILVVAMPMYNFGVPSSFKAWIDRIARAGVTFKYTETGPVGLLSDKKIIVTAARGGQYVGTNMDTQSKYLKDVFAFLGLTDIEFIYAEGLNMGLADSALEKAHRQLDEAAKAL